MKTTCHRKWLVVALGIIALMLLVSTWLKSETNIEYRNEEKLKQTKIQLEPLPTITGGMEAPERVVDYRIETITKFLEKYNDKVAPWADSFVAGCDAFEVDPYLVVAIGSLESGYFRYCVGGNCYGHSSSQGYIRYSTLAEGIYKACELMGHRLYAGKSIKEIGKIYAEDSQWSTKVESIYKTIKSYEN